MSKGRRTRKRKTWNGRWKPDARVGTGKKGAMPEPAMVRGLVLDPGLRLGNTSIPELGIFLHFQCVHGSATKEGVLCARHSVNVQPRKVCSGHVWWQTKDRDGITASGDKQRKCCAVTFETAEYSKGEE